MLGWLLLALMPVDRFDSPKWRVRESATVLAREHLSDPTAYLLLAYPPRSAEQRFRVRQLIDYHWRLPAIEDCPTFDMLFTDPANGAINDSRWWMQSDGLWHDCRRDYYRYRYATWLMMKELSERRVPTCLIRGLWRLLWQREKSWDEKNHIRDHGGYPSGY